MSQVRQEDGGCQACCQRPDTKLYPVPGAALASRVLRLLGYPAAVLPAAGGRVVHVLWLLFLVYKVFILF